MDSVLKHDFPFAHRVQRVPTVPIQLYDFRNTHNTLVGVFELTRSRDEIRYLFSVNVTILIANNVVICFGLEISLELFFKRHFKVGEVFGRAENAVRIVQYGERMLNVETHRKCK